MLIGFFNCYHYILFIKEDISIMKFTPWYKEPWAWLVFFLPFTAVVAGISTYIIANNDPDPLVVGEYYKVGKSINLQVAKVKRAQKLGMRFSLQLNDKKLIITPTGIEKSFPLLNVKFFHPTLPAEDFSIKLTPDGNGAFRYEFDRVVEGKWKITLTPFDNDWKIQDTIGLPQSKPIELIPDPRKAQ